LVAALARDREICAEFPDGAFWIPVGQRDFFGAAPRLLARWGERLRSPALAKATDWEAAAGAFYRASQGLRLLVIADDVWTAEHANGLYNLVAPGSSVLLTTRRPEVAQSAIPDNLGRYELPGLDEGGALELMGAIAPTAVQQHRDAVAELAQALGFMPLALVVAGRMLALDGMVWGVEELAAEILEGSQLLAQKAPVGMVVAELAEDTLPTVAVLLERSTNALPEELHARFAALGAFRPKPATFGLDELAALWGVEDPRPDAARLIKHGLIEPVSLGRFEIHALLQKLADRIRSKVA
jgi:hypothetical protein